MEVLNWWRVLYESVVLEYSQVATLDFTGTSDFGNNSAYSSGGIICAESMEPFPTNRGQYEGRVNKYTIVGVGVYQGGICMGLKAAFSILPKTTVHCLRTIILHVKDLSMLLMPALCITILCFNFWLESDMHAV